MKNYNLILLIVLIALSGCNQEAKKMVSDIKGKWVLDSATRSGKATKTLSGVYVHFLDETKLESNLPYSKSVTGKYTYAYVIDDSSVKCPEAPDFSMKIKSLEENTLVMLDTLYNFPFEFTFKKEAN